MNEKTIPQGRIIGFDGHPDTFTAAVVLGQTPAQALVEKTFDKVPIHHLAKWAQKHLQPQDLVVLEASGNSFEVVRTLAQVQRQARVLESCQMGKLKEAHANNDRISAVRIAKAYLAGTAKVVWVPDPVTQERRDWFHAHNKATKRMTQMTNRIRSYLSDNGVRLPAQFSLLGPQSQERLAAAKPWSARQEQVLKGLLLELQQAQQRREHWASLIAQEVLADPLLLSMVRLCGIREKVAFALGAIIGQIERFADPRKLVKYVGLNPAFDDSGENNWSGGIGGHGRKDLRCLLIEAAHSILRSKNHPLSGWGRKLMGRKGSRNLAAAAVARKLVVAVWYLMNGRWMPLEEVDTALTLKIGKIIGQVGNQGLKQLGKTRAQLREEAYQSLKSGRTYILDPNKKYSPKTSPQANGLAVSTP